MSSSLCFFGSYDLNYARCRILNKGLKLNKVKIFYCDGDGFILFRYFSLIIKFIQQQKYFNNILVGFPGHFDIFLACFLGKLFKKKVLFDIFATKYETYVIDRKYYNQKSLLAKFYFLIDWLGLKLADFVIVDTKAHAEFYQKLYHCKFNYVVVYVGSDDKYFFPTKVTIKQDVLFYGSYQPLQGVDKIVLAAAKLPQVSFKLIGKGQDREKINKMVDKLKLKNIVFRDWVSLEELADEMNSSKIILGIFGSSQKTEVVIPNKVYDGLASQKIVITKKTTAILELLTNNENCLLVDNNNLVTKINEGLKVKKYQKLAFKGFGLYQQRLTPKQIIKPILKFI